MAVEIFKHNKIAYEKVLEHFKKSNRTCVIHPTGTGKSYISLKYIEDNINDNILLLAPTYAIIDQFKRNIVKEIIGLNVKTMRQAEIDSVVSEAYPNITFEIYANVSSRVINMMFDNIILDEFHRCGASEWGKGVEELLDNNPDSKILGVTATPIRYLDDGRDMSKEIFNGDIASYMTLPEAILKGTLPTPTYISSVYSFESDINQIQNQIDKYKNKEEAIKYQELLDKAKNMLENSYGLEETFGNNITKKDGKFIVFCRNYNHMKEMEEKCKEWINQVNSNIEICEVYSKQGRDLNNYYIDYFMNNEKDSLKLLFSIEMLNEGLHVSDIDGVIMFRPTDSPIIYFQQLGRALSTGHSKNPLVFDVVNNLDGVSSIIDLKTDIEKLAEKVINNRKEYENYPSDEEILDILKRFKIIEEKKEIINTLSSLLIDTKYTWDDYYNLAKAYYDEHLNLEIPRKFKTTNGKDYDEKGVALGQWITNQRRGYKGNISIKINEKKIELLKKIGMRFENIDTMDKWMENYNLAKVYYEYYGNLEIPQRFKTINGKDYDEKGEALGKWISSQKQAYKGQGRYKINKEQIELLKKIGMRFETIDKMDQWMENYKLAKAYYDEHLNLEIPTNFKTKNGKDYDEKGEALGTWICNQKQAYKGKGIRKINEEQIELLEKIGIDWFSENIDDKLQKTIIDDDNKKEKEIELKNRFSSLLSRYKDLPTKEEINEGFINQLDRKKGSL